MTVTTLTSQEFHRDTSRAKRASLEGPVSITDGGEPSHVLLSMDDYRKLTQASRKVADLLALPDSEDIEFDVPQPRGSVQAASLF